MPDQRRSQFRWAAHFEPSDVVALSQLALMATQVGMEETERMHMHVLSRLKAGSWLTLPTQMVYQATKLIPSALQRAVDPVAKWATVQNLKKPSSFTAARLDTVSILNGLLGDRLVKTHNPLSISMQLIEDQPAQHKHKLLFIHGLCMNERAWPIEKVRGLAKAHSADVWYLRYNTGNSLSDNARQLVALLDAKLSTEETLTIVGHSMGGLIALQSLALTSQQHVQLHEQLNKIITLGSPIAGASLAKWGYWIEQRLLVAPWLSPVTRIASSRSQGILDLKDGVIANAEFPSNVTVFSAAGRLDSIPHEKVGEQIGDGLVTAESALAWPNAEGKVFPKTGHLALLESDNCYAWMQQILATR